jgi:hypothetical protein
MKYLLLAYGDERLFETMSGAEREALYRECLASDATLRERGRLLAAEGLQSSRAAATVRFQDGRLSVDEGPAVEMREQLIGVFTIDARDLNEAIQVAATMPQARGGPIEVRPVLERGQ